MDHLKESPPTPQLPAQGSENISEKREEKKPEDRVDYCEMLSSGHGRLLHPAVLWFLAQDLYKIKLAKSSSMEPHSDGACFQSQHSGSQGRWFSEFEANLV